MAKQQFYNVNSGGLAVKYIALCAKWFICSDRRGSQVRSHREVETFPGIKNTLNGAAVSTELILRPPEDVIHSDADHPRDISAPSFRTALWEGGV